MAGDGPLQQLECTAWTALYAPVRGSEDEAANEIAGEAERLFAAGDAANQVSDNYVLNGVFLAVCLFFLPSVSASNGCRCVSPS